MKPFLLLLLLLLSLTSTAQKASTLQKAFEVKEKDLIPEGIAYDEVSGNFYVSSINQHKIIQITAGGQVTDFGESKSWGTWGYLGMKVDAPNRVLWACRYKANAADDSAGWGSLYKISLTSGIPLKKYTLPKGEVSHLFNDVLLVGKDVYITDSEAGTVLRLNSATDSLEYLLPTGTFAYPNGLTLAPDKQHLVAATAQGLFAVNPHSKEARLLQTPGYYIIGIDGLYTYKSYLIGLQSIIKPETISKFVVDADLKKIEDIHILANNQPFFNKITTGVIRDNWLYFIANSHISELNEDGSIKSPEKLKHLTVYRLKLE